MLEVFFAGVGVGGLFLLAVAELMSRRDEKRVQEISMEDKITAIKAIVALMEKEEKGGGE